MTTKRKPTLAVWKFASCDGCQLSLLDCEDELLQVAGEVDIAYFLEARRATVKGPYDLSLVEGSVTTAHDAERIRQVRSSSRNLVTIGACATAGGVQALRNFADVNDFLSVVYASPEYVSTLETSTPISEHVKVDFELQGCPISKRQLLEVLTAFLHGKRPNIPSTSVCMECKRRGNVCIMVAHGTPCLGPVTHAGCGAICPSYDRGCYGCFGPMETPNTVSLTRQLKVLGMGDRGVDRVFRTFNVRKFEQVRSDVGSTESPRRRLDGAGQGAQAPAVTAPERETSAGAGSAGAGAGSDVGSTESPKSAGAGSAGTGAGSNG